MKEYTIFDEFPTSTGVYKFWFRDSPNRVYVGSAAQTKPSTGFRNRWKKHIHNMTGLTHNPKVNASTAKHNINTVVFTILELCRPEFAIQREQHWIDFYKAFETGLNCTPTAGSSLGAKHDPENIARIFARRFNKFVEKYGERLLELYASGSLISDIQHELGIVPSTIRRLLRHFNVEKRPIKTMRNKEVYCYDNNGEFLSKMCHPAAAAKKYGINVDNIYPVLSGKRDSAADMYFSYAFLEKHAVVSILMNRRKTTRIAKMENIGQYTTTGELIKIWGDTNEIKAHFNIKTASLISAVIDGKRETYRGFVWKCNI